METNSIDFCAKYRPRTWGDILGNALAKQYLKNSWLTGRIPTSIIGHGDKGSGKNTLFHLYTKSLTCENPQGDEPCGECKCCKSLEANYPEGSAVAGVFYYNCTKIDSERMDEILKYDVGNFSINKIERNIHIFDEFHRIRDRSQDKLLKVVENSNRDIFLFALIDLSVVEPALQQRSIILKTERPEMGEIIPRLQQICECEGIIVKEEDALVHLATEADRLLRGCLKVLEMLSVLGEPLTVSVVKRLFRQRRSIGNDD